MCPYKHYYMKYEFEGDEMKAVYYGKRGMALEEMIEYTNSIYKNKGLALITKVPTDWAVHYDKKHRRVIHAYPNKKGIVDFIGVSDGQSIAFDTKSTNIKTNFPLNNIKEHQLNYLRDHHKHGGISFFLIAFFKQDEYFFLTIEQAYEWWKRMLQGGRKSIPYDWFVSNCKPIESSNGIPLDYLTICRQYQTAIGESRNEKQ